MKRTYIVEKPDFEVWIGVKVETLPVGMVFTHKDGEPEIFLPDGRAAVTYSHYTTGFVREIPYPLERPSSIAGYRHLLTQIIRDMEDTLEVNGISVEVNSHDARIHIV